MHIIIADVMTDVSDCGRDERQPIERLGNNARYTAMHVWVNKHHKVNTYMVLTLS